MRLSQSKETVRLPLWGKILLLGATFVVLALFHYGEQMGLPMAARPPARLGLTRHALDRLLLLVPIAYAGLAFGARGGVVAVATALGLMLPRALFISPAPTDALAETLLVFLIGAGAVLWLESHAREDRRRRDLTAALDMSLAELRFQVQIAKSNERRLAAVNVVASIASQSLELGSVLNAVADTVVEVMKVEIVLIFLVEEVRGDLVLEAHRGISSAFASQLRRMKVGEGLNGRVAAEGKAMVVEDASLDPRVTREAVRQEGIRSQLIAPLSFKGRVVGTVAAAVRHTRRFLPEDVELLTVIGNQVGIAVENARLYEEERRGSERLRASERRYRELFENAQDAIWVQDLAGTILTANEACAKLMGYIREELIGMQASDLLPERPGALEARVRVMQGETLERPYEQLLKRKDGSEAVLQVSVSLVSGEGRPHGFQYIARDITEEKRLQENLRFYHQQVTRAQEEERRRIARELHDDTMQMLYALTRHVDNYLRANPDLAEREAQFLRQMQTQIGGAGKSIQRFSQALRPPMLDELGFLPSVRWWLGEVKQRSNLEANLKVTGSEKRFGSEQELALFRAVQEAISNVERHAQATRLEVAVQMSDSSICVSVSDDGVGFAPPGHLEDLPRTGKLGLAGMHERVKLLGGTLRINSAPGKGTTVELTIPA